MSAVDGRQRLTGAPGCDASVLLRSQVHQVHLLLEEQVAAAMRRARSKPTDESEILSLYVHALCAEDITINLLLRARSPLFTSVWIAGRLVPWDLVSIQGYAEVVYAATDVLLERLTPANLRMAIDLSNVGLGRPDAIWVLNRFILWEIAMTCGELAAKRPHSGRRSAKPRRTTTPVVASPDGRSNGVHPTSAASSNGVVHAATSPITWPKHAKRP
jgi:hypothetical protein